MRYRVAARVDGSVHLPRTLHLSHEGVVYEFVADADEHLVEVGASLPVTAEAFATSIEAEGPDGRPLIRIKGDVALRLRLVRALQAIESHLAFNTAGIERLRWDEAIEERIPETEQEEQLATIAQFSSRLVHRRPRMTLDRDLAGASVTRTDPAFERSIVAMGIHREGMNAYFALRYAEAFRQFFFVVEDYYAAGKSGKAALALFQSAPDLVDFTGEALAETFRNERHREPLRRIFAAERCQADALGALDLLVKIRGGLQHFNSRSSKRYVLRSPFDQTEFEPVAWLAMHVASSIISKHDGETGRRRMSELLSQDESPPWGETRSVQPPKAP